MHRPSVRAPLHRAAAFILFSAVLGCGSASGSQGPTPTSGSPSNSTLNGIIFGIDTPPANDDAAISQLGRTPAIIDGFFCWATSTGQPVDFPQAFVDGVVQRGSTPMITWNPAAVSGTTPVPGFSLADIASGKQDQLIQRWADAAKADKQTILVRLMHEMNGTWYPWGAGVNGDTPAGYVAAFRHVVDIFHQRSVSNVEFVWCVATSSASSLGTATEASLQSYFPGDDYVSWVAMDGYSRKVAAPKSFMQIFNTPYAALTHMSHRPVLIAETATVEDPANPGAKAAWIRDAFLNTVPTSFPRIKAVMYFDSRGNGFTYPIDTSPEALAAIKDVVADPRYQATVPAVTLSC